MAAQKLLREGEGLHPHDAPPGLDAHDTVVVQKPHGSIHRPQHAGGVPGAAQAAAAPLPRSVQTPTLVTTTRSAIVASQAQAGVLSAEAEGV